MKGKEIRDAVNRIQVHPSVKSKVMELSKNKTKHWIKNGVLKPVAFVAVFSFVCIFGSKLPFLHTSPMHNNSQTASLFDGFIIKTYAEGGEEVALSSKEAIPLKEYSPLMSSVPGIPFRLDSIRIDVDEIQISTEKGTLLTWELPNGSVEDQGNFYKCREKTTVYWSPLTKDGALANQGKLIISAFKAGKEVIKAEISIKEISQAKYSAELLSLISKPSMSK